MRLPEGILNVKGRKAIGLIQLQGSDGNDLREYGSTDEGVQTTCLVLTSPGDVITVSFLLDRGVADFADLIVDGILRDSTSVSAGNKIFKGTFKKACHQERLKNGKRGGLKACKMEIQSRDTESDVPWKGAGASSAVGSLEIQLFRKDPVADKAVADSIQEDIPGDSLRTAKRAPNFSQYAYWKELNHFIDPDAPPPSFEIGFTERNARAKFMVGRVMAKWSGEYKLVASVKFKFCSKADLLALGFQDVPTYHVSSLPPKTLTYQEMGPQFNTPSPLFSKPRKIDKIKEPSEDTDSSLVVEDSVRDPPTESRMAAHALPKTELVGEQSLKVSLSEPSIPSVQASVEHSTKLNGDNILLTDHVETEIGGRQADRILDLKYGTKATVPHSFKESPANKASLETFLLEENGNQSPHFRHDNADDEKWNNALDQLLRESILEEISTSEIRQSSYESGLFNSMIQTQKPTSPSLLGIHNGTPWSPPLEPKSSSSTVLVQQSEATTSGVPQQGTLSREPQTNESPHKHQEPEEFSNAIHIPGTSASVQNPRIAVERNVEANVDHDTTIATGSSVMGLHIIENQTIESPTAIPSPATAAEHELMPMSIRKASSTYQKIPTKSSNSRKLESIYMDTSQPDSMQHIPTSVCRHNIQEAVLLADGDGKGPPAISPVVSSLSAAEIETDEQNQSFSMAVKAQVEHRDAEKFQERKDEDVSLPDGSSSPLKPKFLALTEAVSRPDVNSGKRKAGCINEGITQSHISAGPRKTSISPALRKSEDVERVLEAAQSRLIVAERRKAELSEAMELITLLEKVCTPAGFTSRTVTNVVIKARKLDQEAEKVEKENLELQARLHSFYDNESEA